MWEVATSSEGLPTYAPSGLAYYAHVTVDSDKSCVCYYTLLDQQFADKNGNNIVMSFTAKRTH